MCSLLPQPLNELLLPFAPDETHCSENDVWGVLRNAAESEPQLQPGAAFQTRDDYQHNPVESLEQTSAECAAFCLSSGREEKHTLI